MPSRRTLALLALGTALAGPPSGDGGAVAAGFQGAARGYPFRFPRDHFTHPGYRTEWWYFTGRLEALDPPGRSFGYQLTFFRLGLLGKKPSLDSPWASANLVMVHAAVSDLDARSHRFSEVLWREMPYLAALAPFPGHPLAWARAPAGSRGRMSLDLSGEAFELVAEDDRRGLAFRLSAGPGGPPVLEGPDGFSQKSTSQGYASLYYSFPRLSTEGTLEVGGRSYRVRGESWMDHEFGSSELAPSQVGWDWFGLRLGDGRDLMLYLMRREDGSIDYAQGTLVQPGGGVRYLAASEFEVRATARARSAKGSADYPAAWEVRVPSAGIALRVVPALADQEDRSELVPGLAYFEGAVDLTWASGERAGEGYVELTGYGPRSRPPI
ncbi:MAG TPA: lipocalin-like domain-containing protein [Anaeromyxobacteraceae bacterium]|nr:lipocalin-like domain-containing protein [Anaeromyxobacteraceae bacterium]